MKRLNLPEGSYHTDSVQKLSLPEGDFHSEAVPQVDQSSVIGDFLKGGYRGIQNIPEALKIKNSDIAEELALPPVKIHCSVLAEDAIKAALADYRGKQESMGKWQPNCHGASAG